MDIAFLGNFHVDYTSESHHAASLEALGHTVHRMQEGRTPPTDLLAVAEESDLFVWVHTHGWRAAGIDTVLRRLKRRGIPTMTYHLDLWFGLRRQRDIKRSDPYWKLDHFFTADREMAEWLTDHTTVTGHYLPAGVYHAEATMAEPTEDQFDVAFVGSRPYHPEWPYRGQLLDWLGSTYGDQFRHYGNGGGYGLARSRDLNQVYANARVTVGDSLCQGFTYPDYWSDRVYETLGRGGFLIHPQVPGMDIHFRDREHLVFYEYGNLAQLQDLIGHYLTHDAERDLIRKQGHALVASHHTYLDRWTRILEVLGR